MFTTFASGAQLVPVKLDLPAGVHVLCAQDASGKRQYFAVNSTARAFVFPAPGVTRRLTLSAASPASTSIVTYGKYGDTPGEIQPIVLREFPDAILPPYSVNVVR